MPPIARSEEVTPATLDDAARARLCDELYRVHCEVFAGVERDGFRRYVVESPADGTWILVHRDRDGAAVGYFALHVFERELAGKPAAVFRAEAGTLRAYRGANSNAIFGLRRAMAYMARNPGRQVFYLGSLVHPSSYCIFAKYFDVLWPSEATPPPPHIVRFMDELATSFGLDRVHAGEPLVRKVGWRTRDSEAERRYWRRVDRPAARFFVRTNPGYGNGDGLVTLAPLSARRLVGMGARVARERFDRRREGLVARLHDTPLGRRLLRPAAVKQRLRATSLFARFDDATLDRLAEEARVVALPSGATVFEEGDPSDDLYVVARGNACILVRRDDDDVIIDQLTSGAMFGEIAMLGGERRTATVRTTGATVLIQIDRDTLTPILDANPALEEQVLRNYEYRRFSVYLRELDAFRHLSHDEQRALVMDARPENLAADEELSVGGDSIVFVVTGAVRVEKGDLSLLARAPALLETESGCRVTATAPARVIRIRRPASLAHLTLA